METPIESEQKANLELVMRNGDPKERIRNANFTFIAGQKNF